MAIPPVNDKHSYPPSRHARPAAQETNQNSNTTLASENSDNVDFSRSSGYAPTYTRPGSGTAKASESHFSDNRSTRQMKNDLVRDMAKSNISGQAGKANNFMYKPLSNNSTVASALKAAEATSEGKDYWSADATAERIFTFAKNLAGDDDEMFQTMKDAFQKGFSQALGAKRGNLPSISYETRDKVLSMFDDWEKEIKAGKTESTSGETGKSEASKSDSSKSTSATTTDSKKSNPTTTVYGRTYGSETVPYYGTGKFSGYSGTPVKEDETKK